MAVPLLTTKFYVPPVRANRVARPRLTRRLADGLTRKLTLISAPPGFGKTSLIAECIADFALFDLKPEIQKLKYAWLSLDEGDNDESRFLSYIITACQSVQTELGVSALEMLRSPQAPSIEALLTDFINDLGRAPLFVLVLDDYHSIHNPAIDQALMFLIDHLPASLHLVIATRSDPPLRLAQLRARGELLELRASDLRFTLEETAAFLKQVMQLNLSAQDIAALEMRTEGWVAGLQLAGLSMQGRTDAGSFIRAFTGSNRYIISYLVEQVLDRQAEATQNFLLYTSILARLNARLCDAVAGQGASEAMLEQLDSANLFLIPLDDTQQWYRYHHLFAEVLQSRLHKTEPALIPELHARASAWFEQHGFVQEAIDHAIASKDWKRAGRLVRQNGDALLKRSETSTLRQWLDALPEAVVQAQPWLCLWRAELNGLAHQLEAAERYLQHVERAAQAEPAEGNADRAAVLTRVRYLRTGLALNAGDLPRTISLAKDALSNLRPEDSQMRGWLLLRLGTAYLQTGKLADGAHALEESIRLSQADGDLLTALYALDNLAGAHLLQAQLIQAARLYDQALDAFAAQGAVRIPVTGLIHADLAEILYEWNDLTGAHVHLAEAVDLGEKGGLPRTLVNAYIQMVRVRLAEGDLPAAREAAGQARKLVETYHLPLYFLGRVGACDVRLRLAEGNVSAAENWASSVSLRVDDESGFLREVVHLMVARVFIAAGEWEQALDSLVRMERAAHEEGRTGSLVEILALEAVVMHHKREHAAALTAIERALTLAEPSGYVRTFVDEGDTMRRLLHDFKLHIASRVPDADTGTTAQLLTYSDKLLAAFPSAAPGPAVKSGGTEQESGIRIEPLTDRELEILRLIAAGHSNSEIAATLVLAVGTVKKHTNNIFGKLGVRNRVEAVARARERSLLAF